jgi:hypothetical protein
MGGLAYEINGPFTVTSGEALEVDRLVKMSGATAVYCDAGEEPIGIVTGESVASGKPVAILPLTGGIYKATGAKAIAVGVGIYPAANGKISDAAIGNQIGIQINAISADGGKAAAVMWGTNSANDVLSARGGTIDFMDDFYVLDGTATVGEWNDAVTDGGTIASVDAVGGVASIATGGVDNNESYISSQHEIFKFETDKRLFFEARVKLTEANTDDANIIVGLSDTVAADSLLDDGAGPMASYDGVVFFKVDGGTKWQFESSNAGTQDTETDVGDFSDATWTKLGFLYDFNDGVTANITPYVDGVAGTAVTVTIAGLEEMHILLGAKAGGGNAETLLVDYVHVIQDR